MSFVIRLATNQDRAAACSAEGKAIRGLLYLNDVWEEFKADQSGMLLVGEVDGQVVAVGKYTLLYDHSAWLETLRVDPEFQGRGIGKAFYDRFLEMANLQEVKSLGMYTGATNVVSKGLAERYGFRLEAAYRGASWSATDVNDQVIEQEEKFQLLGPSQAVAQLLPLAKTWDGHIVMNRTFYPANAAVFAGMAREAKVYSQPETGSICIIGHRFLEERGLHLALLAGDIGACIRLAKQETLKRGLPQVTIMFPPYMTNLQEELVATGFKLEASDCIVMGRRKQ